MNLEQNFFNLFGLPIEYQVDQVALKKRVRALQRDYHPDRLLTKNSEQQRLAVQMSAHINHATNVLHDPVLRAQHMLELLNIDLSMDNRTVKDNAFLIQQMQLRENLEEAVAEKNKVVLEALEKKVNDAYQKAQKKFSETYSLLVENNNNDQVTSLVNLIDELHFYSKLHQEISREIDRFSLTGISQTSGI